MLIKIKRENKYSFASVDFETTGLTPYLGSRIFSFAVGFIQLGFVNEVENVNYIIKRLDNKDEKENKENLDYLKRFFMNTDIIKISHNMKFELSFCKVHNIFVPKKTIWHCTMLMSQILKNLEPSHALDALAWEYGGCDRSIDLLVKKQFKERGSFQSVDIDLMRKYQQSDIERNILLFFMMKDSTYKDRKTLENYFMELETAKITQLEESVGIHLSDYNMRELENWMKNELDQVAKNTYVLLNEYVNLNSDDTVRRLLFRKYKMPILEFTPKGIPSTDKNVLSALQIKTKHPIFELILKQRSYTGGLATIKSYRKLSSKELILYPNLNTCNTRTSRKSSSKPNLQNVSTEAAEKNPYPVALRKCFIPPEGFVFIVSDYKGIEMRLIVNEAKEMELLNLIKDNPEADLHHPTVECFLMGKAYITKNDSIFKQGVKKANLLKENEPKRYKVLRKVYKNTGFCIAYGGGDQKVALTLGKPIEEILIGSINYRNRFSRIDNFTKSIMEEVRKNGFITTSFGLKRYVPIDKLYIGANYRIQATAAGILKRGQIKINKILEKNKKAFKDIKLVLDVHDENIFIYPKYLLNRKEEILPLFFSAMINMPEIEVPLRIESYICYDNWNDKEEIEVKYA